MATTRNRLVTAIRLGGDPLKPVVAAKYIPKSAGGNGPTSHYQFDRDITDNDLTMYEGYGFPTQLEKGETAAFDEVFFLSPEQMPALGSKTTLITCGGAETTKSSGQISVQRLWIRREDRCS